MPGLGLKMFIFHLTKYGCNFLIIDSAIHGYSMLLLLLLLLLHLLLLLLVLHVAKLNSFAAQVVRLVDSQLTECALGKAKSNGLKLDQQLA